MCSLKLTLCCQQRSRDCPKQKLLAEERLCVLWMLRNQQCRRRWPPRFCNTISSTELRFRKRSSRSFESSAGSSALFRTDLGFLPICRDFVVALAGLHDDVSALASIEEKRLAITPAVLVWTLGGWNRSEEHTSELQ